MIIYLFKKMINHQKYKNQISKKQKKKGVCISVSYVITSTYGTEAKNSSKA